jgi:NAD(P)-dependent dehydrogenase (short-subunit alcohol dehydrogenase family)
MIDLAGRIAIVTGGASGIGRGIARVLAEQGAHVVIADLNAEAATDASRALTDEGLKATHVQLDVTDSRSVAAMVQDVLGRLATIDIVVNNAGVVGAPGWEERAVPNESDWNLTHAVNLRGVVDVSKAVAEPMKERRYGKIINIASIAGRIGGPQNPPYNVSKAGVISWTQGHALELAPYNVNVNAICPGSLWTPLYERLVRRNVAQGTMRQLQPGETPKDLFDEMIRGRTPLGRSQTPEDVGRLAAFLASDDACNITGQAINVDGGVRMN